MYQIYYVFLDEKWPTFIVFETEAEAKERVKWLNENVQLKIGKYIYEKETINYGSIIKRGL